MPIVLSAYLVIGPVRGFGVDKNNAGILVVLVAVSPNVKIPVFALGILAGSFEPRVLVRGVVDYNIDQDADAALVSGLH